MDCSGFEFKEHTADILIEARGISLEEAFSMAGKAVFEIITDTSKVEPKTKMKLYVEGFDLENLLYKWIEELLFYFDAEGMVFSVFDVVKIEDLRDRYVLEAVIAGEKFDQTKHIHKTIVKAMTYADMTIRNIDGCWVLTFVVDI